MLPPAAKRLEPPINAAQVLTLPREAVTFNTYGDSVFMVDEKAGKPMVQRRQIETGRVRGDEVTVLKGLKAGDRVVSAGQVKLNNGQEIQIQAAADTKPPAEKAINPRMNPNERE